MSFLPPEALADERSLTAASRRAVELARAGSLRAGLALASHARRHARSLETLRGEVEALNAAAIVHLIRGDAICAAAAAIDAADLARATDDPVLLGHARLSLAMARLTLELPGDHCAQLSAIVARCDGDAAFEIRGRVILGVALGDAGRFDEAEVELRAALSLSRANESTTTPGRIVTNIANLSRKRAIAATEPRDIALACADGIWHAHWARSLAIEEGSVPVIVDALAVHGALLVRKGNPAEGAILLREAVATGRSNGCRTPLAWVLCELGALLAASGDMAGAREAYAEALEIGVQLTPSRKVQAACKGLADVEERCGNRDAAAMWRAREAAEGEAYRRGSEHLKFDA